MLRLLQLAKTSTSEETSSTTSTTSATSASSTLASTTSGLISGTNFCLYALSMSAMLSDCPSLYKLTRSKTADDTPDD